MYILLSILGIIFLFLDLQKTHILKLTFASGFLFDAVIAYKTPNNYTCMVLGFLFFSTVSYILIKTILKKEQKDILKEKQLDDYKDKYATVIKDIGKSLSVDGIGYIEYKNEKWQAKSIDDKEIKAGNKVRIVSKENMIMNVELAGKHADK